MRKAIIILCCLVTALIKCSLIHAAETDFLFSEIMYDYSGSDNNHEWVEVYNSGQEDINVITGSSGSAWRFFDGSNHVLNLYQGTTTISSQEYFVIADNAEQFMLDYPNSTSTVFDTSMNLLNSSSTILLSFDGGDTYPITAEYDSGLGANGNGNTLEKIVLNQEDNNNWQESFVQGGTPGKINSYDDGSSDILPPNIQLECPSKLLINEEGVFDASSSTDPQGLELSFLWDFMDDTTATTSIATHSFTEQGSYNVSLVVSNSEKESIGHCLVETILEEEENSDNGSGGGSNNQQDNNWSDLIVSEFLPNPEGSDDNEWIELYNKGLKDIDLIGFKLQDNSSRIFTFTEDSGIDLTLSSQEYFVLGKETTKISLNNNGGDIVKLYNPEEELQQQVEYIDKALENKSYAADNNSFKWTSVLTPGEDNIFLDNQEPEAKIFLDSQEFIVEKPIIFSAEESFDPEEGELEYFWDFGDETSGDEEIENHSYQSSGNYLVKLIVTDTDGASHETTVVLEILDQAENIELKDIKPIDFNLEDLIISEFLPNPEGSDDNEWIELHNSSDKEIDLLGWQLDDEDGGSKPFIFKESFILKSNAFAVIPREESKITLNNNKDQVRVLTPLGETWQSVEYQKVGEGNSYAWDGVNKEWFVNSSPMPGEQDYLVEEQEAIHNIRDVKGFDKNDGLIIQGISLYNHATSSRSIYLADYDGVSVDYTEIIEVYSHKKDFPPIKKGDFLNINGIISRTGSLPRLKTKDKNDFLTISTNLEVIEPVVIDLLDIEEEYIGNYVAFRGVVAKKTKKSIYLSEDEEEDWSLRIAIKDYDDLEIEKGSEIIVSGILKEVSSGYKLIVNSIEDILIPQIVKAAATNVENVDKASTTPVSVSENKKNDNIKLILVGLIIFSIIFIFFQKIRKK